MKYQHHIVKSWMLIRPSIQLQVFNEIQGKVSQSVPRGFGQPLSSTWIHSWCSNFDPYPGNLIFVYSCIIYNIAHGTYMCVICPICIYIYMGVCVSIICVCNCIHKCIERERQRKQEHLLYGRRLLLCV